MMGEVDTYSEAQLVDNGPRVEPSGYTDIQGDAILNGALPGDKVLDRPVHSMTNRQLMEETVLLLRRTRDQVTDFAEDFKTGNAMKKMLAGTPFGGMFGAR